jgi:hypothetical protein
VRQVVGERELVEANLEPAGGWQPWSAFGIGGQMPEVLLEHFGTDRLEAQTATYRLRAGVRPDHEPAVREALIDNVVAVQITSQSHVRSHRL